MLSNDVTTAHACQALLLTPKARVIAPLVVVRRGEDDFLLLTEPGLGEVVRSTLLRARFAAKVEIEPEEHSSVRRLRRGGRDSEPRVRGAAFELLDADVEPTLSARSSSSCASRRACRPGARRSTTRSSPPKRASTRRTSRSRRAAIRGRSRSRGFGTEARSTAAFAFSKSRAPSPVTRSAHGEKVVGRVTSAVDGRALAYVRVEVPADAELEVGADGKTGRTLSA